MSKHDGGDRLGGNRLLNSLPKGEQERLAPLWEAVSLGMKDLVCEANGPISHVYFPQSGVISELLVMDDQLAIEVGTVGNEGMVGICVFLGSLQSPVKDITQIPGEALRMKADVFQEEMRRGGPLHGLMHRYTLVALRQTAQLAACNNLHTVQERMCRWLLVAHDRVGSDEFPLTQEFLAEMLVVRRPSVSVIAGVLQRAGLIRYSRGRITVLDRNGLEAATCECYSVFRKEHDRILRP
jgi:CRP-like cAMP-binding protein